MNRGALCYRQVVYGGPSEADSASAGPAISSSLPRGQHGSLLRTSHAFDDQQSQCSLDPAGIQLI